MSSMRYFATAVMLSIFLRGFLLHIYIYIYMSLSYTWCNSYKLTHFLYHRFLRDLTVQKTIKCYYFPPYYLINTSILSLSPYLLLSTK